MTDYTLTDIQFAKLFNDLGNHYDKIDDRKKFVICENFEQAINEYVADCVIQLLPNPDDDKIDIHCLFTNEVYEKNFESYVNKVK